MVSAVNGSAHFSHLEVTSNWFLPGLWKHLTQQHNRTLFLIVKSSTMWGSDCRSVGLTSALFFVHFTYWITFCVEPVQLTGRVINSTACDAPCKKGTFEVMPCDDKHPKLCKGKITSFLLTYFSQPWAFSPKPKEIWYFQEHVLEYFPLPIFPSLFAPHVSALNNSDLSAPLKFHVFCPCFGVHNCKSFRC